jgi:acyl transferase domain-containing protein
MFQIGVKSGFSLDEDLGVFNAPFFSMTASEANTMDPMHRWMLEVAYEGLENASISMSSVAGSETSCFVGCFTQDYGLMSRADLHNTGPYMATGIRATMLSNRVSWFFDLHGPSISIDTAYSSSMYALHLACQSIKSKEVKQAIVGGTNLLLYPDMFYSLSKMYMISPDGKCHSFDSRANGYARGEAIGVLIVKSLIDAIADGDTVRAIIRNTGCNQDGRTPSITMPSAQAQADLISKTYAKAGLSLSDTAYFEAHGTGTPLGDPLELSALGLTFGAAKSAGEPPLYVSSVKTNVGHTEGCSALAGVIKAMMSIEEGVIAPNAEFETLNPKLRLDEWKLALPPHAISWPTPGVRRVSVNSFGYGGANGHVILDDAASFFKTHNLNGKHTTRPLPEIARSSDDSGFNSGSGSEIGAATNTHDSPRLFILSTFDQVGI